MLVISVALIFFQLGKTTHPTFTGKKSHRQVQLASPVFPVPQVKKVPRVTREKRKPVVKKSPVKSKARLAKRFRKHRKALSRASTIGAPPKLVKE